AKAVARLKVEANQRVVVETVAVMAAAMGIDARSRRLVGALAREIQELRDDARQRVRVSKKAAAVDFVRQQIGAYLDPRDRRAQVMRDTRKHHRALLFGQREFMHHLIEIVDESL